MEIEVLLSTMNLRNEEELKKMLRNMGISSKTIIINQLTDNIPEWKYITNKIELYSYKEKGISKSRNKALEKARGTIEIIADDDIKYENEYENIIKEAYEKYEDADIIAFYVESKNKLRKTRKQKTHKINWITAMKIQSVQITFKNKNIKNEGIKFKEEFGTGSKYFLGEDSIFLYEMLKRNKKMYYVDEKIGEVNYKNSTWFNGYTKEFFFSEGATFYEISKKMYIFLIFQYAIRKQKLYKNKIGILSAIKYMLMGAKEYEKYKKTRKSEYYNSNI